VEEAAGELRNLLRDVVRRHLISDVRSECSQRGLVPANIAAVMAELMDELSGVFDRIERMLTNHHHEGRDAPRKRSITRNAAGGGASALPQLADLMTSPGRPAILPTYLLAKAARAACRRAPGRVATTLRHPRTTRTRGEPLDARRGWWRSRACAGGEAACVAEQLRVRLVANVSQAGSVEPG